jgi:NADH-quinone oxidoreductase subunit N
MANDLRLVLGASGLFNLLLCIYPAPLIDAAGTAAKSLF